MADILEVSPEYLPVGSSPLHLAANNEDIKTLTLLLHSASTDSVYDNIDLADKHGRSPLVVALRNGRFSAAKVLVEYGASLDVPFGVEGMTVHEALSSPVFHPLLEMLVQNGVKLSSAVAGAFAGLVHPAAYNGRTEFLETLLEQYELDVNVRDNLQCTPLHYAVQRGHPGCVKTLLVHGAKLGAINGLKLTSIHLACFTGELEILKSLMEELSVVDESTGSLLNAQDCSGRTPLHIALYYKQFDAYVYLVSEYGALIDSSIVDMSGHTLKSLSFTVRQSSPHLRSHLHVPCLTNEEAMWVLHDSVARGDHEGVVFALESGAVIDSFDFMQQTPLLASAKQGSLEVCQTLVEMGAKVNVFDMAGRTPAHYAAEYGHSRVFSFLVSLPDSDLTLFYNLYEKPLTSDVLQSLLVLLESSRSVRPNDWQKWLSLAAVCATSETFRLLAGYICPGNVIDNLLDGQTQTTHAFNFKPVQIKGPFLSTLLSESEKEKLHRSSLSPFKPLRKTAFKCTKKRLQLPSLAFKKIAATKKAAPLQTPWLKKNKVYQLLPFQFHYSSRKSYSPLHDVVKYNNIEVFDFILSEAVETSVKKTLLSLKDENGVMVLNRVAEKWESFASVVDHHGVTEFLFDQLEKQFPLHNGLPFEVAVMLYVFSGGPTDVSIPFLKWPDWYLDLRLSREYSLSRCSLQREDQCKGFVTPLVESAVYEKWYSYLLSVAVRHKCVWGARLVLCQQPSVSVYYHQSFTAHQHVLVEAARKCDTEMIDLLLQYYDHPLLKLQDGNKTASKVLQGLITLASHGFVDLVEQVFDKFIDCFSWSKQVREMVRLLYIVLCSSSGLKFGKYLVSTLASYICSIVVKPLSPKDFKCFLKTLRCHLLVIRRHFSIELILQLVIFMQTYCLATPELTLHYLCSMGRVHLVRFMLLDPSTGRHFANSLDRQHRSPLYYAACGGHMEIVNLLMESGYRYDSDIEEPPALGYLAHLCYAPLTKKSFRRGLKFVPCYTDATIWLTLREIIRDNLLPRLVAPSYNINAETPLPSEQKQLFCTLFALSSSNLLASLSALPVKYNCSSLNVIFMFAGIEDHSIIDSLLTTILDKVNDPDFSNLYSVKIEVEWNRLRHFTIPVYTLDSIIAISPSCRTHHCSRKFDSILAKCNTEQPLKIIDICAQKGYWKLLLGSSLSNGIPMAWYGEALIQASLCGQADVVSALCYNFDYKPDSYLSKALRYAVVNSHLQIVETLQTVSNTMTLEACTKYNSTEALLLVLRTTPQDVLAQNIEKLVIIATRRACLKILELLLPLYCDSELMFGTNFRDRNLSFWYVVLLNAAMSGHETLCLQAVACISDSQLREIRGLQHDQFVKILDWCCYWGMADLLDCLPYSSDQLLHQVHPEQCCPVETAIVHGHIGKLSHLKCFPSLEEAIRHLSASGSGSYFFKGNEEGDDKLVFAVALFTGAFHKVCSESEPRGCMPELTSTDCCKVDFTAFNNNYGLYNFRRTKGDPLVVNHLGKYAGPLMKYLLCRIHVVHRAVCSAYDNVSVLEIFLKTLFECGAIDEALNTADIDDGFTPLAKAVCNGLVGCSSLLLRSGAKSYRHPHTSDTLLHYAVKSGSLDVVKLLLDSLEGASDLVLERNVHGIDPITLAFSLGYGRIARELIQKVSTCTVANVDYRDCILPARGWFRELMEFGARQSPLPQQQQQTSAVAIQCNMNIRKCSSPEKLFLAAAKSNYPVLESLFVGCGNTFPVKDLDAVLDKLFLNSNFLQLLENQRDAIDFGTLTTTERLSNIFRKCLVKRGIKPLMQLLKLLSVSISDLTLLTETFLAACVHKEFEMVQYLLETHLDLIQNENVLEEGVALAVCNGSYDVASYLMVAMGVPFNPSYFPPGAKPSLLIETIFTSKSYHKLLDELFSSIVNRGVSERLPFASAWTVHEWTEKQSQLVTKNLDGPCTPSNPWLLTVQTKDCSNDVVLSVDWDTFSECLVRSPLINSTSSKFNPLLLETTIFSPAILGSICESFSANTNDYFSLAEQRVSSLILSCVSWPSEPSLTSFMEEQGILTLSYNPQNGVFVFPKGPTKADITDTSFSTDSGIQNESSQLSADWELTPLPEEFQSIADSHIAAFKKTTGREKMSISVAFSNTFHRHFEADYKAVVSAVDTALSDCFEILKLCRKPNVLYSRFHRELQSMGLSFQRIVPKMLVKQVQIHVCLMDPPDDYDGPQVTSLEEDENTLNIVLPIEGPSSDLTPRPPYDILFDKISDRLLKGEIASLKVQASKMITGIIVPQLKKSLGYFPLDPATVTLSIEDQHQETHKLDDLEIEHLVYLKSFRKVKKVLLNFVKMLKVFSYKPRLQSAVRRVLEAGLHLCITNELSYSRFFLKAGVAHIVFSLSDLHRGTTHISLLDIFDSLLRATSAYRQSTFESFLNVIPAPFACAIDRDNSPGLLYPKKGSVGIVKVKLVGYDKKEFSSSPTSTCILDVKIKAPSGKIMVGSSSQEPGCVPNKNLMADASNGEVVVRWTPKEVGIHRASFRINGIPISDGTVKVFVPRPEKTRWWLLDWAPQEGSCGSRTTAAGDPVVFIASQTCYPCSYSASSPRIVLKDRKSVRSAVCSPGKELDTALVEPFSISSTKPQHYISLYSFFGGSQNWQIVRGGDVTIHITKTSRKGKKEKLQAVYESKVSCIALGNGLFRISLMCTTAGSFSVFPSCPMCQAVMKMHWNDRQSFEPASCYVLPGSFSELHSSFSLTPIPPGGGIKRKKKETIKMSVKSGGVIKLYLKACDMFGNPHTVGGAVRKVVVSGGGLRAGVSCTAQGVSSLNEARNLSYKRGKDVECNIEDDGNGVYSITGQVYNSGSHTISVTDQCGMAYEMRSIRVEVAHCNPCASHCVLLTPSQEAVVSEKYTCFLYLYDPFFNPCDRNCISCVKGSLNDQRMNVVLLSELSESIRMSIQGLQVQPNCVALSCAPSSRGKKELRITVNNEIVPTCPVEIFVIRLTQSFAAKIKNLRASLRTRYGTRCTPTITIDRSNILESAVNMLQDQYFNSVIRVRFGEEPGIDVGGPAREFFHLLCLEFVNPQYALFQSVNGLYRPNPNSAVNPNHLFYFNFFGKILAKTICDGHQMMVRFTPAVYKYLLKQECTLDDLKIEDPSLHMGLFEIMNSDSEEELEQIALNFTASMANFGALRTIELEQGGENRKVTMANRHEFVHKLFSWHLIGCVQAQLDHLLSGFNKLVPPSDLEPFLPHELEVVLSGPPEIDVSFIRRRSKFTAGYNSGSQVVKWLWEILEEFTQEERSQFLQFTTGCACHPSVDMGQWEFVVQKGSDDCSLLPVAATCFNSLSIPPYFSKAVLKEKLTLAISYGRESFLRS